MMDIRRVLIEAIAYEKFEQFSSDIVKYVRGFGSKGKLPSYSGRLKELAMI